MSSFEVQFGTNVKGTLDESILVFKVIVDTQVLGNETQLGFGDIAFAAILKRKLKLGKAIEELAGDLVEEDSAFTVELSGHSKGRSFGKWEDKTVIRRRGWRSRICCRRGGWQGHVIRASKS